MKVFMSFISMLFVILLCGCGVRATSEGGENSLQNNISIENYEFSKKTKEEIESNKDKIVITELLDTLSTETYEKTSLKVATFINTVESKMLEEGYTIISSDTNGMGEYGQKIFVTLIFEKADTVEQLG